jgi:anti-anti-sigma factor
LIAIPLHLSTRPDEDRPSVYAVRLRGDVDAHGAPRLTQEIERLVASGARLLVVDCTDVEFMDSSGLRALVAASELLQRSGGQLLVEGMSATVQRVLEITGLLSQYTRTA